VTQDEIIEMAQECNLIGMRPHLDGIYSEALVAFANLVAAKITQQEQDRCCAIVFGQCESDNVAQRTVNAIRGEA
jgi:hypothetical protein